MGQRERARERERGQRTCLTTSSQKCEAVPRKGGLAFEAHRLLYHSTQGLRVIKKQREGKAPG